MEDESTILEIDNPSFKVHVIEDNENRVEKDNFGKEVVESETQQIFILISELNLFPSENFPYTSSTILEQSPTTLLRIGYDGITHTYDLDYLTFDTDPYPYTLREPIVIDLSQTYPGLNPEANAVLVYFEGNTRKVVVGSEEDINTAFNHLQDNADITFEYSSNIADTLQTRLPKLQFVR